MFFRNGKKRRLKIKLDEIENLIERLDQMRKTQKIKTAHLQKISDSLLELYRETKDKKIRSRISLLQRRVGMLFSMNDEDNVKEIEVVYGPFSVEKKSYNYLETKEEREEREAKRLERLKELLDE